ncbi:MAG TPA: hypothetical protein V6D06_03195 [Trichocoleus sp.]
MATLTAAVALGTLPATLVQLTVIGMAQPPAEVLKATDDRGSGRLTASLIQPHQLGFRGSGRLDDESEEQVGKSSAKASWPERTSPAGSNLLPYRGSGRIAQPRLATA